MAPVEEGFSGRGELDAAIGALQQGHAQLILKVENGPTQGRLGNPNSVGGAPKMEIFGDGHEASEMA